MADDHIPARRLSSPCSPVATEAAGTPSAAERLPLTPPSWAAPSGAAAEGRHELRSLLLALCPRLWPERSELVSPRGHGRRGPGREGRSWPPGAPRSSGVTRRGGWRAEQRPGGGRYLKHRPPLGPCLPLDQTRAAQIGRGPRSAARSPRQADTGARRGVAWAHRRAPADHRGPQKPRRSSRAPFWAKPCAGLGRDAPGPRASKL